MKCVKCPNCGNLAPDPGLPCFCAKCAEERTTDGKTTRMQYLMEELG